MFIVKIMFSGDFPLRLSVEIIIDDGHLLYKYYQESTIMKLWMNMILPSMGASNVCLVCSCNKTIHSALKSFKNTKLY